MPHAPVDADPLSLALLDRLLHQPRPRTCHALGQALAAAPEAVARAAAVLEAHDCALAHHPQQGIMLECSGLPIWSDYLRWRQRGPYGRRTLVYRRTDSTQSIGARLARGAVRAGRAADAAGYVITADHQDRGRGRLGARWRDQPGGQLLTTILAHRPDRSVDALMLGACHAAAAALQRFARRAVHVKWPNDLLIDGRKVGGILVEQVDSLALIGVGLNVTTAPPADGPTHAPPVALAEVGDRVDRLRLLSALLDELHPALHDTPLDQLAHAWRRRAVLMQHRITAAHDGRRITGRVLDIDPVHGLLLEVERGPVVTLPAATTHIVHW